MERICLCGLEFHNVARWWSTQLLGVDANDVEFVSRSLPSADTAASRTRPVRHVDVVCLFTSHHPFAPNYTAWRQKQWRAKNFFCVSDATAVSRCSVTHASLVRTATSWHKCISIIFILIVNWLFFLNSKFSAFLRLVNKPSLAIYTTLFSP